MAAQLREQRYDRTFQQCREKTKKLRQEYKKVKDKIKETGQEGRRYLIAKFEYFEVLDAFLANRPATQPKVVIDSLADQCTSKANDDLSDSDDSLQSPEITTAGNSTTTLIESSDDATVVKFTEGSNAKSDAKAKEDEDTKPQVDVKPIVSKKKNRKRQIEMIQDTMKGMIKQVVDAQKESDQKFADLEEK